jgi:hypothetical protein
MAAAARWLTHRARPRPSDRRALRARTGPPTGSKHHCPRALPQEGITAAVTPPRAPRTPRAASPPARRRGWSTSGGRPCRGTRPGRPPRSGHHEQRRGALLDLLAHPRMNPSSIRRRPSTPSVLPSPRRPPSPAAGRRAATRTAVVPRRPPQRRLGPLALPLPAGGLPYEDLRAENGRRSRLDPEYELFDTRRVRRRPLLGRRSAPRQGRPHGTC